jgi:thymidine kinase
MQNPCENWLMPMKFSRNFGVRVSANDHSGVAMAKLYFRFGTVGAGKTLALVNVAQSYKAQGKAVLVMKPRLDLRYGEWVIRSRTGLELRSDVLIDSCRDVMRESWPEGASPTLVLVDEAQFLDKESIDELRHVATIHDIPVICYGIRTDFRTQLFPGSARLFEVADQLEEIKSVCQYCRSKAVFNLRLLNGEPVGEGPVIVLGDSDTYQAVCGLHYYQLVRADSQKRAPDRRLVGCTNLHETRY